MNRLAGLRAALSCGLDSLPAWVWRVIAVTPPGLIHERLTRPRLPLLS